MTPTIGGDKAIEQEEEEIEEEEIPFKYSITSYGADYTVDGLVKRLNEESVFIPPFQRSYVWTQRQASRFVESLLLGLPVPGVFFSKEEETQKLLVIDGQQRLRTLQHFYEGIFPNTRRQFSLVDVQSEFEGMTYKKLPDKDRRRLDDSIIHATVVKQDKPSKDNSSIYHIFERLNTGGTLLKPQQIRACIYHGEFNKLLSELNGARAWRDIFGPRSKDNRDQELILRFLALNYGSQTYHRPMKEFLNQFMGMHRHLDMGLSAEQMTTSFTNVIEVVRKAIGVRAFKPARAINAAVFDAVMVGLSRRLSRNPKLDLKKTNEAYLVLLNNPDFATFSLSHTTDEEPLAGRIALATQTFDGIP